jgi:hypothetical protein
MRESLLRARTLAAQDPRIKTQQFSAEQQEVGAEKV